MQSQTEIVVKIVLSVDYHWSCRKTYHILDTKTGMLVYCYIIYYRLQPNEKLQKLYLRF